MDILNHIYTLLKNDPFMHKHVEGRFMYNEMPDVKDIQITYVAINPIVNGAPVDYADGKRIADAKSARVDVLLKVRDGMSESPRTLTNDIMECIADILDDNNYRQIATFSPEYDKEHKLYRESRSFEINYYRSDY